MRFSVASAVLCAVLAAAPSAVMSAVLNNAGHTCGQFDVIGNGHKLAAKCTKLNGDRKFSEIGLGQCLDFNFSYGRIECVNHHGNLERDCKDCFVRDGTDHLVCKCGAPGYREYTFENLNKCINNADGVLGCDSSYH